MNRYDIDQKYIIEVAKKLIQIDTVNDPNKVNNYWPGIHYIKELMEALGLQVTIDGKENFPNIVGLLKGTKEKGKILMLNAHLDTVPIGDRKKWKLDPFAGEEKDGYVYGRGACDMKGQIAMLLGVIKYFVDNKIEINGDLKVSIVTGHETGSVNGSVWVIENKPELFDADLCFIPEATSGKITVSSRGILWVKAATKGLMGHTAVFNSVEGEKPVAPINGIHKMLKFANRVLDVDGWMTYEAKPHTGYEDGMYSEKPIVEMNIIEGGEKQNTVPDICRATFDIRFLPGQTPEQIMKELNQLAEEVKQEDNDFEVALEIDMIQSPPIYVEKTDEIFAIGTRAFQKTYGQEAKACGVCAPGDAVAFGRLMPVVWQGPKWDGAHGYNERFEIEDLISCANLYINIVLDYL